MRTQAFGLSEGLPKSQKLRPPRWQVHLLCIIEEIGTRSSNTQLVASKSE